jgi:hypothetical protein
MSETQQQPEAQPPVEHQTGYTGTNYPWMADPKQAKTEQSARHLPPMMRRSKKGGKR